MLVNNNSIADGLRRNKDRRVKSITANNDEIHQPWKRTRRVDPDLVKMAQLVKLALHYVPINNYLKVGPAIKRARLPYFLWLNWAAELGYANYADLGTWNSFRIDHKRPITVASIFWIAQNNGFSFARARKKRSNSA